MQPAPASPAGYSGTPLPKKLGIKPGSKVLVVGAPVDLDIGPLPAEVVVVHTVDAPAEDSGERDHHSRHDVALFFTASRSELAAQFPSLTAQLTSAGSLWVCWPKRASRMVTDMTEDAVREAALPLGWVDNKVCAIDARWSGLRLVLRVANRPKRTRP